MSPIAKRQRHSAALKHGKRSPVMLALGKKFGCTKPDLHEGTPDEYDPENCVFCQARWDHLLEVRTLLGSTDANLLERAATSRIDIERYADTLRAQGTNPITDKHYMQAFKLDIELAKHLQSMGKQSVTNVIHHRARDDEEDFTVIDVSRVMNE